jgi:hypothetical protein
MKITDEHRLLLLKLIKFDGNVQPLIDLGYEFSIVAQAIKLEEQHGNAKYAGGQIEITSKGLEEINKLETKYKRKFPWIEPELGSKIKPLSKDEIYIPDRDSIRHLFK